jgi:glycine cleavage system H protein
MEALLRRRLPPLHMECIYHPAHTWVRRETPTRARIGLDAFVARIAGRPRGVVLPPPGTPIRQGHPCAWLDTPGGTLTVLAPISGLVVEANGVLTGSPEQTGAEPFAGGWLLLLLPSDWEREAQRLAPAEDFHRTVARDLVAWRSVVLQAIRARSPAVGPTFADGGTRVTDLDQLIGPRRRWEFALPYFAGHPRQPPRRSRRGS